MVAGQNPNGLGYVTNYPDCSALNDLLTVTQGSQTRSFSYDSFGRLTQAINPESGTINYTYANSSERPPCPPRGARPPQ